MLTIARLLQAWVGTRSVNSCAPLVEATQSTLVRWLAGDVPTMTRIPAIARGTGYPEDELRAVAMIERFAKHHQMVLGRITGSSQLADGSWLYFAALVDVAPREVRAIDTRDLTVPEIVVGDVVGLLVPEHDAWRIRFLASDYRAALAGQDARLAPRPIAASAADSVTTA